MNHTWPASGNPLDSSRKTNALAIRRQHSRARLGYGSDLLDAEWAILASFLPALAIRAVGLCGCGLPRPCAAAASFIRAEIVRKIEG